MFSAGELGSYFLSSTLDYVYLEVSKPLMNKWLFNGKLKYYIGNKQGFNRLSTLWHPTVCWARYQDEGRKVVLPLWCL